MADDKQKGSTHGFYGLSALVSEVEESPTNRMADLEVTSMPIAPRSPELSMDLGKGAAVPSAAHQPTRGTNESSTNVTTGKWMLGIALGIGLLLIVFIHSTKREPSQSTNTQVAYSPDTVLTTYSQPSPATESIEVLGQKIIFTNPKGYCTLGNSPREVELMNYARRMLGTNVRPIHLAVRCSELVDYREERREVLDHWLQIQLIGVNGTFQRFEMSREEFLTIILKSLQRLNTEELQRTIKGEQENSDIKVSEMNFETIGRDGNAVYSLIQMRYKSGETYRPVTGVSGTTLLNSLPLSINVYEATGSLESQHQLHTIQQELLSSLLAEN